MKMLLISAFSCLVISFFKPATPVVAPAAVKLTNTEKVTPSAIPSPVHGLWVGEYTCPELPEQGSKFYSFVVYPDGVLLTKGLGGDGNYYYATGRWTLTADSVFTGTIESFVTPGPNPVTQTIKATFKSEDALTNGSWQDIDNPNGAPLAGSFSVMKKVK